MDNKKSIPEGRKLSNPRKEPPNCAKCLWKSNSNYCKAQGNKSLDLAYNTAECKKLYDYYI